MRRLLMYGRYCRDEVMKRETSELGKKIYQLVRERVQSLKGRSKSEEKTTSCSTVGNRPRRSGCQVNKTDETHPLRFVGGVIGIS